MILVTLTSPVHASDRNIVFVSSHLLTEMQHMAEHAVVDSAALADCG